MQIAGKIIRAVNDKKIDPDVIMCIHCNVGDEFEHDPDPLIRAYYRVAYDVDVRTEIGQAIAEPRMKETEAEDNGSCIFWQTRKALKIVKNKKSARSRFGGEPDLPPGYEWPTTPEGKPLGFIAQIDCSELPEADPEIPMPKSGIIYFFRTAPQSDEDCHGWRVFILKDGEGLQPMKTPGGLMASKPFSVAFQVVLSRYESDMVQHQMFGYPVFRQIDTMPATCVEMTADRFAGEPSDWVLLLQVVSDYENSDMDSLYFWIRRQDLAEERFDRVWMLMECC